MIRRSGLSATVALLAVLGIGGLSTGVAYAAPATASRTVLTVHPNPATTAQAVTLFSAVRPAPGAPAPTGTVTFLDGTTALGTATLTTSAKGAQVGQIQVHFTRGLHSLTASYGGDAANAPSTSAPVSLRVTQAPRAATGTTVTEVAGVAPHNVIVRTLVKDAVKGSGVPTGSVKFKIDNRPGQTVVLNSKGRAHLTLKLPAGRHHATVTYLGDSTHTASSGSLTFTST